LADLEQGGPWRQADTMSYDEVVLPDDLRHALIDSLRLSSARSTDTSDARGGRDGRTRPNLRP